MSTNVDSSKKASWADAPMASGRAVSSSRLELNQKLASISVSEEEITSELLCKMLGYILQLRVVDSSDVRQGYLRAVIALLRKPATKLSKSDVQKVVGDSQRKFIPQQIEKVVRVGQKQLNVKAKGKTNTAVPVAKPPDPAEAKIRASYGSDYKNNPEYVDMIRTYRLSKKGPKTTKQVV